MSLRYKPDVRSQPVDAQVQDAQYRCGSNKASDDRLAEGGIATEVITKVGNCLETYNLQQKLLDHYAYDHGT
jgi:hypothetical protein